MSYRKGFLLYLVAFLLQPFLYHLIPALGGNLNLILCLTVILTYLFDETLPGLVFGLVFGLLSDMFYGIYVGPGVFSLMVTGVLIFVVKKFTNKENFFNAVWIMLASTYLYASLYWLVYYLIGSAYSYVYMLKSIPLMLLFNLLAGLALYIIFIKRVIKYRRDRYFK